MIGMEQGEMKDIWRRIDDKLAALIPDVLEDLGPLADGATEERIAHLEGLIGVRLPEDVRESYAIHDGTGGRDLYATYGLADLESMGCFWEQLRELSKDADFMGRIPKAKGPIREQWWNPKWIPMTDPGSGNHICIDLDPAEGGSPGQLIDWDHERGPTSVIAPSLRSYLERFADDLDAGRLRFDDMGNVSWIG
jgi:cell wall assembly regulator SMI1